MFSLGLCDKAGLEIHRAARELQDGNGEVRSQRHQLQSRAKGKEEKPQTRPCFLYSFNNICPSWIPLNLKHRTKSCCSVFFRYRANSPFRTFGWMKLFLVLLFWAGLPNQTLGLMK